MKRDPPEHRVFISSRSSDNPYAVGDTFTLDTGLYCDTVMRDRRMLLVRNATKDPLWDKNPDLKHGMAFYLGLPLAWPDGAIFGTICVLDEKTNEQAIIYADLLAEFKEVVESDLKYLMEVEERKAAQGKLQRAREALGSRVRTRLRRSGTGLAASMWSSSPSTVPGTFSTTRRRIPSWPGVPRRPRSLITTWCRKQRS